MPDMPVTRLAERIHAALLKAEGSTDVHLRAGELAGLLHAERVIALADGHVCLEYREGSGAPVMIPENHHYVVVPAYQDPEIEAMAVIYMALHHLRSEQAARVMAWAHERYGLDGRPEPF